jgi:hypothetical protein
MPQYFNIILTTTGSLEVLRWNGFQWRICSYHIFKIGQLVHVCLFKGGGKRKIYRKGIRYLSSPEGREALTSRNCTLHSTSVMNTSTSSTSMLRLSSEIKIGSALSYFGTASHAWSLGLRAQKCWRKMKWRLGGEQPTTLSSYEQFDFLQNFRHNK